MAHAQHTQKRQQADLFDCYSTEEELAIGLRVELDSRGPWAYQEVCPACGEEPAACDCDLHE